VASDVTLFLISLVGAVGCVVRYVMEYSVRRYHPTSRPWATVAANALGCGIAGYAAYRLVGSADTHVRDIVITGFCGGLTTFSSAFAIPAILQREHHWGYSAALIVATPLACAGLFLLGMSLAH
jgi:CrcB protein